MRGESSRVYGWTLCAGLVSAAMALLSARADAQDSRWQSLYRRYAASVVLVTSGENLDRNLGSGFFTARDGHAVVVIAESARPKSLLLRRFDGTLLRAQVVRTHAPLHLVFLRSSSKVASPLRIGDSSRAKQGEAVGVMGYTTQGTLTIRSATIAAIQSVAGGLRAFRLTPSPTNFLPGAAVLNRKGEVIALLPMQAGGVKDRVLPIGYLRRLPVVKTPAPVVAPEEPPLWKELAPIVRSVRQIPDLVSRAETLVALSILAAQGGCEKQAQTLWKEAVSTTDKLESVEERGFALSNIALALARAGQLREAIEVATPIPDPLYRAIALSQVVQHAAQRNQTELALQVAEQLGESRYRCDALVAVSLALHRAQSAKPAEPTSGTEEPTKADEPNAPSAELPAPSPAQQLLQTARQIAEQQEGFDRIVALATVSAGLWGIGSAEEAQATLDAALQAAQALDTLAREQALQEAAGVLAEHGLTAAVETLLKQLPAERQDSVLARLGEAQARQAQLAAAQTAIERIRDRSKRARAALALAQQRLAQGDLEGTSALLTTLPLSVERIQLEVDYALALAKQGQAEAAQQHLQQAESAARRLSDSRYAPEATAIVAVGYLRQGDFAKADALFEQALNAARTPGEPWTSALYARIWLRKAEALAAHHSATPASSKQQP
ncbi:MAG: hypothetical protein NZ874_03250 [Fimbriimonadales bacterium]|nr:hypothetical protein [Fimbriimonadales bacterium]